MSTKRLQARHVKHAALRRQTTKRDKFIRTVLQPIIKRKSN